VGGGGEGGSVDLDVSWDCGATGDLAKTDSCSDASSSVMPSTNPGGVSLTAMILSSSLSAALAFSSLITASSYLGRGGAIRRGLMSQELKMLCLVRSIATGEDRPGPASAACAARRPACNTSRQSMRGAAAHLFNCAAASGSFCRACLARAARPSSNALACGEVEARRERGVLSGGGWRLSCLQAHWQQVSTPCWKPPRQLVSAAVGASSPRRHGGTQQQTVAQTLPPLLRRRSDKPGPLGPPGHCWWTAPCMVLCVVAYLHSDRGEGISRASFSAQSSCGVPRTSQPRALTCGTPIETAASPRAGRHCRSHHCVVQSRRRCGWFGRRSSTPIPNALDMNERMGGLSVGECKFVGRLSGLEEPLVLLGKAKQLNFQPVAFFLRFLQ
jgi:hypothetical protein